MLEPARLVSRNSPESSTRPPYPDRVGQGSPGLGTPRGSRRCTTTSTPPTPVSTLPVEQEKTEDGCLDYRLVTEGSPNVPEV